MTTNNHPAHGPVSLDRLHQIREHLQHDTQYSNGGNRAYILADMLKVIDGAIAAFDVDPISQCDSRKQFEEHFGDGTTPGMERVPPFFVEMMKDAFWTVWEDSRAAMLQAGNSPVIPDGWISCSERMPDEDGNYWGWWSECKQQGPVWFTKSDSYSYFQSSEITHWMPLPAAPQQEMKS